MNLSDVHIFFNHLDAWVEEHSWTGQMMFVIMLILFLAWIGEVVYVRWNRR